MRRSIFAGNVRSSTHQFPFGRGLWVNAAQCTKNERCYFILFICIVEIESQAHNKFIRGPMKFAIISRFFVFQATGDVVWEIVMHCRHTIHNHITKNHLVIMVCAVRWIFRKMQHIHNPARKIIKCTRDRHESDGLVKLSISLIFPLDLLFVQMDICFETNMEWFRPIWNAINNFTWNIIALSQLVFEMC